MEKMQSTNAYCLLCFQHLKTIPLKHLELIIGHPETIVFTTEVMTHCQSLKKQAPLRTICPIHPYRSPIQILSPSRVQLAVRKDVYRGVSVSSTTHVTALSRP